MRGLYHRDIGFPDCVGTLIGKTLTFRFTRHALYACLNDRYEMIQPPASVAIAPGQIIEADTDGVEIYKIVLRVPYNPTFDLCIALFPNLNGDSLVKTCWLNEKKDAHSTLDKSKYQTYVVP